MKMTITAKKMQIPQNFTEYAEKRLNSKLDKFFGEEADAKITMATHKNLIVIELTVDYNNMKYRAEQSAVDKEDALDAAIDKIIRQIRRNKTRVEKKLKDSALKDVSYEDVVPESDYEGHTFFMFLNANTGETNVVYKRADGKYAVLEPVAE